MTAVETIQKTVSAPKDLPTLRDEPGEAKSIAALLTLAVDRNVPVETLEKLVTLHERVAARQAAQEFAQAMADFQSTCPPIAKTSEAKIMTKGGGQYKYKYAELDEIARTVNPRLAVRGLSYSWDSTVENGRLRCICTVRHVNGHSVTASFDLPIDNPSAMSNQQQVAAALTFARRQSLIQVLGLTTTDPDTDGATTGVTITDEQQATLQAMVEENGIDRARFLAYLGVGRLAEILAVNYTAALNAVETWKRNREKAGR